MLGINVISEKPVTTDNSKCQGDLGCRAKVVESD